MGTDDLHIYYANGRPSHCKFNSSMYTYVYSLQGDVLGLKDSSGTLVATYLYDAWGKEISRGGTLANTLGAINPFRYRGYVYDEETGLYYLRSRYYDPDIGRFISSDSILGQVGGLLQHNLFCYCGNNVVNAVDFEGTDAFDLSYNGAMFYLLGMEKAKEKYNNKTVNVYIQGEDRYQEGKINIYFDPKGNDIYNIHVIDSLSITNKYDMQAILEVVTQHELYSVEKYGSIQLMTAQWIAHDVAYRMATSGNWIEKKVVSLINYNKSATDTAQSALEVDIRPNNNITLRQMVIYSIYEMMVYD